jgi:hypothetical protein
MDMVNKRRGIGTRACVGAIIAIFLVVTGCSSFKSAKRGDSTPPPAKTDKEETSLYYDFGDVLIPKGLKTDKKASFIYQTPGFSAGVLVLSGRIELNSLITFFENNMAKDNWQPVSKFKSPRTIMLFKKENRWCFINITDKQFTTHTEIWVAPTISVMDSGLLK